jgi:protein PhnA
LLPKLNKMEVKDSNGNLLADGDTVVVVKTLKVKGSSMQVKKGLVIKRIRLTDNEDEVDCKVDGQSIVLRTEYLKKG